MKTSAACARLRLSLCYPPIFGVTPHRRPSSAVSLGSRRGSPGGGRGRGCCARRGAVGARGGGQRRAGARGKRLAGPRREVQCAAVGKGGGGGNGGSGAALGQCRWAKLGAASPRLHVRVKRFGRSLSLSDSFGIIAVGRGPRSVLALCSSLSLVHTGWMRCMERAAQAAGALAAFLRGTVCLTSVISFCHLRADPQPNARASSPRTTVVRSFCTVTPLWKSRFCFQRRVYFTFA